MNQTPPTFLTAKWNYLIMANYPVEASVLEPYLPAGTELDLWNGQPYVSVVGFLFLDTRVMGVKIPFHTNFEELNLRFYVRRFENGEWHRGVVFVQELVPKFAIAWVARYVYNEKYTSCPMRHTIREEGDQLHVSYSWKVGNKWSEISVEASRQSDPLVEGSEEEFIAEHYWGFAKQKDGSTKAYQVAHPRWEVFPLKSYRIEADFGQMYGDQFLPFLTKEPSSVFLAKGSEVSVHQGVKI